MVGAGGVGSDMKVSKAVLGVAAGVLAGLSAEDADHVGQVTAAVCEVVEVTAFDGGPTAHLDVKVRRHAHEDVEIAGRAAASARFALAR